jgi:hypothetical protein
MSFGPHFACFYIGFMGGSFCTAVAVTRIYKKIIEEVIIEEIIKSRWDRDPTSQYVVSNEK